VADYLRGGAGIKIRVWLIKNGKIALLTETGKPISFSGGS
jgi:hypothetical protein